MLKKLSTQALKPFLIKEKSEHKYLGKKYLPSKFWHLDLLPGGLTCRFESSPTMGRSPTVLVTAGRSFVEEEISVE